jgi:uncharacterized protein YjlB
MAGTLTAATPFAAVRDATSERDEMTDDTRAEPQVETFRFADDGTIPNNPSLPLLVYRGAVPTEGDVASALEELFERNDWSGGWRNGIYPYHHFHSTAHEVLGIAKGSARVRFGGDDGAVVEVATGDVVVVPAGTGHRCETKSGDLLVVGAYPGGKAPDMCTGKPGERPKVLENIRRVSRPSADPVLGKTGPLLREWRA